MLGIPKEYLKNLYYGLLAFVIILSAFFLVKFLTEIKLYRNAGNSYQNLISVSGHGEITALPDIATISFVIKKEAVSVKEAQGQVAEIEAKVLEFLTTNEIAEKDIKTVSASFNPKYEYRYNQDVSCGEYSCPPGPGKSVIVGYEAYENLSVKIRNVDNTGKIIEGLGSLGVSELTGPNFTIDDEADLKAEARRLAIKDAQAKAKTLAANLGISLGKVSSFYENEMYPQEEFYGGYEKSRMYSLDSSFPNSAELPQGENLISSDVTITFQIR